MCVEGRWRRKSQRIEGDVSCDIPQSVYPYLRLMALLGSVTNFLYCRGDCADAGLYAYANDLRVSLRALTDLAKD